MDYKKLAVIGGSLVGAGALFYYFYNSSKGEKVETKNNKILTRDVVLATLKSLKKELFTICLQMSYMAEEMKRQSRGGRLDFDIKEFIFSYPAISQEMQNAIKKAHDRNKVTEADFQFNCETTFADDKEIQTQMKEIKQMVDGAAEGKKMNMETDIPEFLTQEKLVEILTKVAKETTEAMRQLFKKIKDQYGELNLNDPKIHRHLQTLQADDIKNNIFAQYNLEDYEDSPNKIISFATQKFASEAPEFQEKMMQLELKQRKSMEIIMQNPDNENIVEEIFNEPDQQLGGMGGMGGGFAGFHSRRKQTKEEPKATPAAPVATAAATEVKAEEKTEEKAEEKTEEKTEEKVEEKVEEKTEEVAEVKAEEKVEEVVESKVEEVAEAKVEEHVPAQKEEIEESVEVVKNEEHEAQEHQEVA